MSKGRDDNMGAQTASDDCRKLDEQYARDPARHGTAERHCGTPYGPLKGEEDKQPPQYHQPPLTEVTQSLLNRGLVPEHEDDEAMEEHISPGIHARIERARERVE